jgi:hypothetical protein
VNYDFAGFRLDAAKRQLIGIDGSTIHLPSRAYDVLLYMAERPGEMLEKSALLQAVWPKTVVEENNLTQCIFSSRRFQGAATNSWRPCGRLPQTMKCRLHRLHPRRRNLRRRRAGRPGDGFGPRSRQAP